MDKARKVTRAARPVMTHRMMPNPRFVSVLMIDNPPLPGTAIVLLNPVNRQRVDPRVSVDEVLKASDQDVIHRERKGQPPREVVLVSRVALMSDLDEAHGHGPQADAKRVDRSLTRVGLHQELAGFGGSLHDAVKEPLQSPIQLVELVDPPAGSTAGARRHSR